MARTKQTARKTTGGKAPRKVGHSRPSVGTFGGTASNPPAFESRAKVWILIGSSWVDKGMVFVIVQFGALSFEIATKSEVFGSNLEKSGQNLAELPVGYPLGGITKKEPVSEKRIRLSVGGHEVLVQFPSNSELTQFTSALNPSNHSMVTSDEENEEEEEEEAESSFFAKEKKRKRIDGNVRWFWKSDNGWVQYDAATSSKLEAAMENGDERVDVDAERFVDLEEMLQRRKDDESRRRSVKRVENGDSDASSEEDEEESDSEDEPKKKSKKAYQPPPFTRGGSLKEIKMEDIENDVPARKEEEAQEAQRRKAEEDARKQEKEERAARLAEIEAEKKRIKEERSKGFQSKSNSVVDIFAVVQGWGIQPKPQEKEEEEEEEKPKKLSKETKTKAEPKKTPAKSSSQEKTEEATPKKRFARTTRRSVAKK